MPHHFEKIQANGYVARIVENYLSKKVEKTERFATGLSHYVFDVVTEDGSLYVIRLARPERKSQLEDGLYWQKRLEKIGVPLPKIYSSGEIEQYPFVIYQRLPGADLEEIYATLSSEVRKQISHTVADIQRKIHTLDDPRFQKVLPWSKRLQVVLHRSEHEILQKGLFDKQYVASLQRRLSRYENYLTSVEPVAFLYDTSVRNVIVYKGEVSGLIDVDDVWFGDPLLAIGRGKTISLLMQEETDYISYWCEYLNLSDLQMQIVNLYALLYCIRFMGTSGQKLNGNLSVQTRSDNVEHLERVTRTLSALTG